MMTMRSSLWGWTPDAYSYEKTTIYSGTFWVVISGRLFIIRTWQVYLLHAKMVSPPRWILWIWCWECDVPLARLRTETLIWPSLIPGFWCLLEGPPFMYFLRWPFCINFSISFFNWQQSLVWCSLTLWNLHHLLGSNLFIWDLGACGVWILCRWNTSL